MTLECIPSKVEITSWKHPASMSHQNSTPVQLYATCLCLPKSKAKENGHCQKKILPRLLKTIWQRKDVWKTLFQNKSSGTINPVYLPRKLLNNTKNVSINKTLSITTHNSAQYFYPATLEEHPINNNDLHRVALAQHLLYHSKGEMLRREQSKGHSKGTRAWHKNIQSL